jgi:hypothetical protein
VFAKASTKHDGIQYARYPIITTYRQVHTTLEIFSNTMHEATAMMKKVSGAIQQPDVSKNKQTKQP